jgi:hypothetical protein
MAYTTIPKSTDYFNTKLYTGNGSAGHSITGVGHQPDFTWIKNRSANDGHHLYDAVRGVQKRIRSDTNAAEATTPNGLTSFNSDGFTVGTEEDVNTNNENFASWNWKANGQGSSNTDGSINTTYTSANTTSGFSIIKWTGTGSNGTIGHGLGIAPELVFYKTLGTGGYYTYAKHALGSNGASGKVVIGFLENTAAWTNDTSSFQSTDPSSTLLYIGGGANLSGANIAYCFASITGFSKIGSYIGNGNADGTFVYTGFKPAFIMAKKTSSAGDNWFIFDSKRAGYNVDNNYLHPNTNGAEGTTDYLDIISNGFKLRTSGGDMNANGSTYIFMAFAEAPLVSTNGDIATAR